MIRYPLSGKCWFFFPYYTMYKLTYPFHSDVRSIRPGRCTWHLHSHLFHSCRHFYIGVFGMHLLTRYWLILLQVLSPWVCLPQRFHQHGLLLTRRITMLKKILINSLHGPAQWQLWEPMGSNLCRSGLMLQLWAPRSCSSTWKWIFPRGGALTHSLVVLHAKP